MFGYYSGTLTRPSCRGVGLKSRDLVIDLQRRDFELDDICKTLLFVVHIEYCFLVLFLLFLKKEIGWHTRTQPAIGYFMRLQLPSRASVTDETPKMKTFGCKE